MVNSFHRRSLFFHSYSVHSFNGTSLALILENKLNQDQCSAELHAAVGAPTLSLSLTLPALCTLIFSSAAALIYLFSLSELGIELTSISPFAYFS